VSATGAAFRPTCPNLPIDRTAWALSSELSVTRLIPSDDYTIISVTGPSQTVWVSDSCPRTDRLSVFFSARQPSAIISRRTSTTCHDFQSLTTSCHVKSRQSLISTWWSTEYDFTATAPFSRRNSSRTHYLKADRPSNNDWLSSRTQRRRGVQVLDSDSARLVSSCGKVCRSSTRRSAVSPQLQ